jgi:hypothetical protein
MTQIDTIELIGTIGTASAPEKRPSRRVGNSSRKAGGTGLGGGLCGDGPLLAFERMGGT